MILAVEDDLPAPRWVGLLVAAAEWGVPPWVLTREGGDAWARLQWLERWQVYRVAINARARRINNGR